MHQDEDEKGDDDEGDTDPEEDLSLAGEPLKERFPPSRSHAPAGVGDLRSGLKVQGNRNPVTQPSGEDHEEHPHHACSQEGDEVDAPDFHP